MGVVASTCPQAACPDPAPSQTSGAVVDRASVFLQLVAEKKIDKNLLPPKKIIGKNSRSLVEKREKDLEVYLQTLLAAFPGVAPSVLAHFLHFHLYVSSSLGLSCQPTTTKLEAANQHEPRLSGELGWSLTPRLKDGGTSPWWGWGVGKSTFSVRFALC